MELRYARIFLLLILIMSAGCSVKVPVYGLKPEYPENRLGASEILFTGADSLQPTFRWESFPRPGDLKNDGQRMLSGKEEITYDLKILSFENGRIVHSRQGLTEPYYKIEEPLEPCTKYLWTVRAHFNLDGQPRVTEWGISVISRYPQGITKTHGYPLSGIAMGRRSPLLPNPGLFRFRTPCMKPAPDEKQASFHHST